MKMNFKLIKLSLPVFYLSLLTICSSLKQVSIFSQMDFDSAGNNNNNPSPPSTPKINNNFQNVIDTLKEKVTNPFLKQNFTAENIANFFTHFLSGNEFLNNMEVKDYTSTNKMEVTELMKIREDAKFEELRIRNNLYSKIMNVTMNNEIVFDDEAVIKLQNSPIVFKARDIFETIAFLKYIIRVCGSKMEKCDFNSLLKSRHKEEQTKLMQFLRDKYKKFAEEYLTHNKTASDSANIKSKNLRTNDEKPIAKEDFKFKEENSNFKTNESKSNKLFEVNKEIESQIELEFNNYKENSNDYENFINSSTFQDYADKYYYGNNLGTGL